MSEVKLSTMDCFYVKIVTGLMRHAVRSRSAVLVKRVRAEESKER